MISATTRFFVRALTVPTVGAALLATDLPPAGAAVAAADPVAVVGSDRQVTFEGRGFGHGRGMSQWGAYGAADAGLSWKQIISFYYPGATQARQNDSEMRIWISRDNDGATQLPPQAGLRAVVGRSTYRLPVSSNHTAWRAVQSGSRVALQFRDAKGTWRAYPTQASTSIVFLAGDTVTLTMPGGANEEFPGRILALSQGGRVITVAGTTMERYLRGVVPSEMPASWHPEAVAAQAVAARTYASSYRARQRAAGKAWDICDSITCQVYRGTAATSAGGSRRVLDDSRATAAIVATGGTVLKTPGGNFVHAEFSASNGGHTVDGGAFSQVAKPDPYDARMKNTNSAWSKTAPASTLEKTFGLGSLTSVQVIARDGFGADGGRATKIQLVGTVRTVDVSGTKMRQVLHLKSDWFVVRTQDGVTKPGTGRLPAAAPRPSLPGVTSLTAEWSGDRTKDRLAVSGGRLTIARGVSGAKFAKAAVVPGSPSTISRLIGVGDVNYDRRSDVLAIDTRGRLLVLKGTGKARISGVVTHGGGWNAFRSLDVRDVTKDRRVDIIGTYPDGSRRLYVGTATGAVRGMGAYTAR